jgi:hypothetical protein
MLGLPFEPPQQDVDAVQVHDPTEHAYYDAGLHLPLVLESLQQQMDVVDGEVVLGRGQLQI